MGGACSRNRAQSTDEESPLGGTSAKFSKSGSFKWLLFTLPRSRSFESKIEQGKCPTLMELCIAKVREDISKYSSFSMLPKDISQQIFNELVNNHSLTESSLESFHDCALQDIQIGEYPGVKDSWMEVIASQGQSLLSVDISCSDVSDCGLDMLKECPRLKTLNCNYCDVISDTGLNSLSGSPARGLICMLLVMLTSIKNELLSFSKFLSLSNLSSLSLKKNAGITAKGMKALSKLVNLVNLDLERCSHIHGGLIHIKDLTKLESLNLGYCKCITDSDMKHLSGLKNLKELLIPCCKVTDVGVSRLKDLLKIEHLNLEGCLVTAACLEIISGFVSLVLLNLSRCGIYDEGCDNFAGLSNLKSLNLGFNNITDACLVHLKDLMNLESLNLDSCKIGDEGLSHMKGSLQLRSLVLSDTDVGNSGLCHLSGLKNLKSINLSFTLVTDNGLKKLSGLASIKYLNLDSRHITDAGLAALTCLSGITHLDLFGARVTDLGTNYLKYFKKLESLELCGGLLTDAGVKNIKDLTSLTLLNLSQNSNLTDRSLEIISGLTSLVSLNMSNSRVSNSGLHHLKALRNLRSLTLESCKVTATALKKIQLAALPNLINVRPE